MPDSSPIDQKQRSRFRWGVLLAWSFPVVFVIVNIFIIIPLISRQRTTGAVAGGVYAAFEHFGIVIAIIFQITAIVLLIRAWPGGQSPGRTLICFVSICCALLILFICGAAVWSAVHRVLP